MAGTCSRLSPVGLVLVLPGDADEPVQPVLKLVVVCVASPTSFLLGPAVLLIGASAFLLGDNRLGRGRATRAKIHRTILARVEARDPQHFEGGTGITLVERLLDRCQRPWQQCPQALDRRIPKLPSTPVQLRLKRRVVGPPAPNRRAADGEFLCDV